MPLPAASLRLFQSTPPRREVTTTTEDMLIETAISIHTSPKGGDLEESRHDVGEHISIHTSPKGGDTISVPSLR